MTNISISLKVLLIALIPTAAAVFFSVNDINRQSKIKDEAETINKLMQLSTKFSSLTHELQAERGMSAGFIASKGTNFGDKLPGKKSKTDSALTDLETLYSTIKKGLDNTFTSKVEDTLKSLSNLETVRNKVIGSTNSNYSIKEAVSYYSGINQKLLSIIPEITKLPSNAEITRDLTAFDNFINGKEYAGLERAGLNVAFSKDSLTGEALKKVLLQIYSQDTYFKNFKNYATSQMINFYDVSMNDSSIGKVQNFRKTALSKESGFNQSATEWFAASTARINVLKNLEDEIGKMIISNSNNILAAAKKSLKANLFIIAVCMGIITIMVFIIRKQIVGSLKNTIEILQDIAEGDGQLHKRLEIDSKDEIGEMAHWFNQFICKIEDIVINIQDKSLKLAENASNIAAISSQMDQKMREMREQSNTVASAVEQLNMNVTEVSKIAENMYADSKTSHESSQNVSGRMQTINTSLDKSQESISSIASSSEQMSAIINEIASNTEQTRSVSMDAVKVVDDATTQVEELSASSSEISKVIDLIAEISEQTKTLALNATIEAARAGAAGKGFAVVASEVKELARGTMEATESVRQTVEAMKSSTEKTVQEISRVKEIIAQISQMTNSVASAIEEQSSAVSQNSSDTQLTAELLKEVFDSIRESIEGVNSIANNVGLITSGAQDVSNNTGEAKNATTEVAQNLLCINDGINENSEGINNLSSSSKELAGFANELRVLVNQFEVSKEKQISA